MGIEDLGNKIKKLRNSRKLTAKDFSKEIGISRPALSNYETSKRYPEAHTLIKMANFFEVSVDYLLGNDSFKKRPKKEIVVWKRIKVRPKNLSKNQNKPWRLSRRRKI